MEDFTDNTDWLREERDHQFRVMMERNKIDEARRRKRIDALQNVGIAFIIFAAISLLVGAIWSSDHSAKQIDEKVQLACVENGGTWASIGGGRAVCVRVENVPEG